MTNGMSEIPVAQRSPTRERSSWPDDGLRRTSLGMSVALLVQSALGMWVNLYVTVPKRDQGGGVAAAVGRALSNGPAALAVHAGIGLILVVGAISLVIRAIRARHRMVMLTSLVSLLAIVGAAGSGAAFVNTGSNGASLSMALLTGLALLCFVTNLFVLPGNRPRVGVWAGSRHDIRSR